MRSLAPLAVVLLAAVPAFALADSNPATQACPPLPGEDGRVCKSLHTGVDVAARLCRVQSADECTAVDGEPSPATYDELVAYREGPTRRALALQFRLGDDLPLARAVFPSTHNSFNAEVYRASPSGLDANQRYSLYDQLLMDVRALELDVHWWPSIETAEREPVLCHAEDVGNGVHAGCTSERVLTFGLEEIGWFLTENQDDVLLLYIEDHLDGDEGYDRAAAALERMLGPWLYTPADAGRTCEAGRPLDVSRADVLAAGKQVIVVSGCGSAAWSARVFDHDVNNLQGGVEDFAPYPDCGHPRAVYDAKWIRYWEDATWLTHMASGAQAPNTPETAREMTRCGVNMPGFDLLAPDDGRLDALVWSWDVGQPSGAGCVAQNSGGRFEVRPCAQTHPYACRVAGGWEIRAKLAGCDFDVPRSGYEQERLLEARGLVAGPVWVDLRV